MSKTASLTAQGVIDIPNAIVFGLQLTSVIPAPPPSGLLSVVIRDDASAGGSGEILARMTISQDGMQQQMTSVTFPAGVRVTKGVAVNVTANGHDDILVVVDYA